MMPKIYPRDIMYNVACIIVMSGGEGRGVSGNAVSKLDEIFVFFCFLFETYVSLDWLLRS